MRFLVDRCAGRRLADWLRGQGHDVLDSWSLGVDPGDDALLALAAGQERVLVTLDTDFGRLIHRDKASHGGLVRLPDVPAARRIEIIKEIVERHADALNAGAIVTVRGKRVRISTSS